jgi:hypothetical protein
LSPWPGTITMRQLQFAGYMTTFGKNIRLDNTKATNYRRERLMSSSSITTDTSRNSRHSSRKRSYTQTGAPLPPNKRSYSTSPTKVVSVPNRVHQRVGLRDYGKAIREASSRLALLAALEDCIEGHESPHAAGFLHRDISINNLMINEDDENPSWPSFLIDLDLSIKSK